MFFFLFFISLIKTHFYNAEKAEFYLEKQLSLISLSISFLQAQLWEITGILKKTKQQ